MNYNSVESMPCSLSRKWSRSVCRIGAAAATVVWVVACALVLTGSFFAWFVLPRLDNQIDSRFEVDAGRLAESTEPARELFSVVIHQPHGAPRVLTDLTDAQGNAITVSCSSCHATRPPNFENKSAADLNEFHGSLSLVHGDISCLSCHHPADYDALTLADGSRVEFKDVMKLCGQCHGPQMTDYQNGAHGGMNGYWDLSRGPRTKNNCVDCHRPHTPQFPRMLPTFKPNDRFLDAEEH